jgi:exopolyphosphatase / guanosine-5'-triphosphate,3'-diphosphate pyrophosphatase
LVVGVIDIGTNTTRLLVAEVAGDAVFPLLERRHFATPAGSGARVLADLVASEAAAARDAGAEAVHVIGTASLRGSPDVRRLDRSARAAGAGGLRLLSEAEEARLAYAGAVAAETGDLPRRLAVIDVGGGSTEIAVGSPADGVEWWASRPVGSRRLTERAFRGDPPTRPQLAAAGNEVRRRFGAIHPPDCDLALAVGGGTASLRKLCGPLIDRDGVVAALERVCAGPAAEVAKDLDIDARRVRLLPAALVVLGALCELLPEPLRVARGGMREGLALQLAGSPTAAAEGA